MNTPTDNLIAFLKHDKVIPVVGAGAAYAVAGLPGWKGTVESGFQYAEIRRLNAEVIKEGKQLLEEGEIIKAASMMKRLLNAPGHPFSNWLEELFGNPPIRSTSLLESIDDLCTPMILTTNYDTLLYSDRIRTKEVYDWSEYQQVDNALRKNLPFILHLHGIVKKPETIILSSDDYKALSEETGYKEILKKLWTGYHFLFIGCSRDGVMDEDISTVFGFLNEWFPTHTHQHFILMNERDLQKGLHALLLEKCNVEAISIGLDYAALPDFINSINPNREKSLDAALKIRRAINVRVERLRLPSGAVVTAPAVIAEVVKECLPDKTYRNDSLQLKYLEEALGKLNEAILYKRQTFEFYQATVSSMVGRNEITEAIRLWERNRDNPAALNNEGFIGLALRCFDWLQRMPTPLMEDIRRRDNGIHEYYFDGYLAGFVKQYRSMKQLPKVDVRSLFQQDDYFSRT